MGCGRGKRGSREQKEKEERREERMQRKSGRPSGTDGSDFSYRMVVDSRYTKVANGKSRLSVLIIAQAVIQLLEALNLFYSISKEESLDVVLAVSSISIYFTSLLTGELGRKRSRVNLLKFYMVSSSIGMLLSIVCVLKSNLSLKVIQDLSGWETKKSELFWAAGLLVGLLVQILSISTTSSIISNMSPPKRAT